LVGCIERQTIEEEEEEEEEEGRRSVLASEWMGGCGYHYLFSC
jgi:hypothetical protein